MFLYCLIIEILLFFFSQNPSRNLSILNGYFTYSVYYLFQILIQSVCETMVPKLVAEDIPLLFSLLSDVFPGVQYMRGEMTALREELKKVCGEMYLTYGDGDDVGSMWVEKVCS